MSLTWVFRSSFATLVIAAALLSGAHVTNGITACREEADLDPMTAADIVVGGRTVEWSVADEYEGATGTVSVEVVLQVEQTFKGDGSLTEISFVDESSLIRSAEPDAWVAGIAGCGILDADPTGRYFILGLEERDGSLYASRPLLLFTGEGPTGSAYAAVVDALLGSGVASLPESSEPSREGRSATVMFSGLGLVSLAAALWIVVRPRRSWLAFGD